MDISKHYIRMCRKAKEIQKYWKVDAEDRVYYTRGKFIGLIGYGWCFILKEKAGKIWLPREDQLREMIGEDSFRWFENCWKYVELEPLPLSAEMVGLERLMKIKHNKTWNGEDWI